MKKVLATWMLVMTLGSLMSFAQVAPVTAQMMEQSRQSKILEFSEICVNDLPEAVMNRLAMKGAMIKQAFMAYSIDGSRIYKVNVLASNACEETLLLSEDGKLLK